MSAITHFILMLALSGLIGWMAGDLYGAPTSLLIAIPAGFAVGILVGRSHHLDKE